jgi:hypothetical protein
MSIGTGVVVAVAFGKVDDAPDGKACTESDDEGLKYIYCTVKEFHSKISFDLKKATLHTPEIRLQKAENHGEG